MFDEHIYKETFSSLHASNETLTEVIKMTQENKKRLKAKRIRIAVVCAAAAMLLACTALAVYYANTVLAYFNGDTALIEPAVQVVDKVMEQGEYKIFVDSTLSDAHSTVVGLTIEALTDEAAAALNSDSFRPTGILRFESERTDTAAVAVTYTAVPAEKDSVRRSFSIRLEGIGAPNALRIHLAGDNNEKEIVLALEKQIESLSVAAESNSENSDYFIRSCVLNATGVKLDVEFAETVRGDKIIEIYFRMADGSLKTLSQLCGTASEMDCQRIDKAPGNVYRYIKTFPVLIDPLSVAGVVMNGMEYSFLNSEYTAPAEVPETMRPFLTPFVEADDVFCFFADDVCGHIGASIEKNGGQYTIRYLGRVLAFSPEDVTVTVDGKMYNLEYPATYKDKELVLSSEFFALLGLENTMYYPELGPVHAPENWLVAP